MVEPAQKLKEDDEEQKSSAPIKVAAGEEEIKLTQVDKKLQSSLEDREKYQLIFDMTGDCETFFKY